MACEVGKSNSLYTHDVTAENLKYFVTLVFSAEVKECYYITDIYNLQKDAYLDGKPFISPFNTLEYTDKHIAEIERVRQLYVNDHPKEAKSYPQLNKIKLADIGRLISKIKYTANPNAREELQNELDILLASGKVDETTTDLEGYNLLFYAIESENLKLVEKFFPKSNPTAHIMRYNRGAAPLLPDAGYFLAACKTGNFPIIKFIVSKLGPAKARADVDLEKRTGLHFIANRSDADTVKIIEYLIKIVGINPNQKDRRGETPLHLAAGYDDKPEIVEVLIKNGADVNIRDDSGYTPLHTACYSNNKGSVSILLNNGAEVNIFNNEGVTPLYNVATKGYLDVFNMLIQHGAINYEILKKNTNGPTTTLRNTEASRSQLKPSNLLYSTKIPKFDKIIAELQKMPLVEPPELARPAKIIAAPKTLSKANLERRKQERFNAIVRQRQGLGNSRLNAVKYAHAFFAGTPTERSAGEVNRQVRATQKAPVSRFVSRLQGALANNKRLTKKVSTVGTVNRLRGAVTAATAATRPAVTMTSTGPRGVPATTYRTYQNIVGRSAQKKPAGPSGMSVAPSVASLSLPQLKRLGGTRKNRRR